MAASHELGRTFGVVSLLQWLPSHTGVKGNETADGLAREAMLAPTFAAPSNYLNVLVEIRRWELDQWYVSWDTGSTARNVWPHLRRPNKSDPWWKLKHADQAIISQCRTGHAPIGAYFVKCRPNFDDRGRHCGSDAETVDHLLN